MSEKVVEIDDAQFQENLRLWVARKRKSFGEGLRMAGRIAVVNFAKHTQPFGLDEKARQLGEQRVASDIRRVYATPGDVWKQLRFRGGDEGLADAFWYFFKIGKLKTAQQLVDSVQTLMRGVPIGSLDPALHQRARNRRGRIPNRQPFLQIVTSPKRLETYVRQRQTMVGFAKAGWATIGRQLGRTRGIPQWVTRHKTAPGSLIDASENANDPHIVLRNHVRYIDQVASPREQQEALSDVRMNLLKFLELQLKDDFIETPGLAQRLF